MLVTLPRIWKTDKGIIGIIDLPGIPPFFSLELPWRDNCRRVSCIPPGLYHCVRGRSTKNKSWGEAFYVENVPGRSRIIFGHIANKPADLLGCVGFGLYYAGKNRIGGSVSAINLWMKYVKGTNEFDLLIINDPAMSFERDIGVAKRVTY